MAEELTLYHYMSCPYCQRVRAYLENSGISVAMKDIQRDPAARDALIQIGGKGQVPCLVIDGLALYESSDIIDWFTENLTKD